MEDTDFSRPMTREKFESLSESLLSRVLKPCQTALQDAGITIDQISSVEVVGSSSRVPSVQKIIEEFFKKPVSRTLNAKECIARGCALQCAMLSPVFKVKDFEIVNCQAYGISFTWEKDGQPTETQVFPRNSPYPATKMLSFFRSESFTISAMYSETNLLPPFENPTIGCFEIGPVVVPKGAENAKIKVKVRVNLHGILEIDSVYSVEEEEIEVPVEVTEKKAETEEPPPNETEAASANGKEAEAGPKLEKKIKIRKFDIPFVIQKIGGMDTDTLNNYFELEGKMAAEDKLFEETHEKKNAVESYVYTIRSRLSGDLMKFAKPTESEPILKKLEETENWLYEEGEHQMKSVYVAKLEELKKMCYPIILRHFEAESRPVAAQLLNQNCENYIAMARSESEEYNHIEAEEKKKVIQECETATQWLHEKLQMQQQLVPSDDPVILTSEINKKQEVVNRVCQSILQKPKPKPAKKEEPKPPQPETEPKPAEAPPATENAEAMDTSE